jgi:hypothetical protein
MSRIHDLETMEIYGNAHDDRTLLQLAHSIIVDESESMADRIAAIRKLDEAMGEQSVADEDAVYAYVHDAYELLGEIPPGTESQP